MGRWLLGCSYRKGQVLRIGLALAGCEGNHVVECIWFHSCEYSRYYHARDISRIVAGHCCGGGCRSGH